MIKTKGNIIKLDTENSSIIIKASVQPELLYYGERIEGIEDYPWIGSDCRKTPGSADDYYLGRKLISSCGDGTNRETMIHVVDNNGCAIFRPELIGYNISDSKPPIRGMRSSYGESQCLQLIYEDKFSKVRLEQYFSVFNDSDVISSYARIINGSDDKITVKRLMSLQLDMGKGDYSMTTLNGSYGQEKHRSRKEVSYGTYSSSSFNGLSSNVADPFMGIVKNGNHGYAIATNLIYSGNHKEIVDMSKLSGLRVMTGINDYLTDYGVKSGDSFYSPEAIFVMARDEISVSEKMRSFVATHVVRGYWKDRERPVLINSWESFLFDFNSEKLQKLCAEAKKAGIELFVLDDGWFGKRNSDNSSLGDWKENCEKLGGDLEKVSKMINDNGLAFGIWMEPEMVSINSDLYRSHPDYAMVDVARKPIELRNQIVLDITKKEVRDYIVQAITDVVERSNAKYLKWDCNRGIYELIHSGSLFYDYVLSLYDILERINGRFPKLLIEGCASGGNRFDLGMLCYVSQIWGSDNTDPRERLLIQDGALTAYPQFTIGAHIGHNPNFHTFNSTSLYNAFSVALTGAFGYEFDLAEISEEKKTEIKKQVLFFKENRKTIQFGDMYISDYITDEGVCTYSFVDKDKKKAVAVIVKSDYQLYGDPHRVYVRGLDKDCIYSVSSVYKPEYKKEFKFVARGDALENVGFRLENMFAEASVGKDFNSVQARIFVLERVDN